jgi:hypothetical protein
VHQVGVEDYYYYYYYYYRMHCQQNVETLKRHANKVDILRVNKDYVFFSYCTDRIYLKTVANAFVHRLEIRKLKYHGDLFF